MALTLQSLCSLPEALKAPTPDRPGRRLPPLRLATPDGKINDIPNAASPDTFNVSKLEFSFPTC